MRGKPFFTLSIDPLSQHLAHKRSTPNCAAELEALHAIAPLISSRMPLRRTGTMQDLLPVRSIVQVVRKAADVSLEHCDKDVLH